MKKKLPLILIILFFILVFIRIFVIYISFDMNFANEKRYDAIIGNLKFYQKPYEENALKFRFASMIKEYEPLSLQINEEIPETIKKKTLKINEKLNKLTEKYLLKAEVEKPEIGEKDTSVSESTITSQTPSSIEFDEKKLGIQQKTLKNIKSILSPEDYKILKDYVDDMNRYALYNDNKLITDMYFVLSKYDEIPAQITINQLRGLYEVLAYYEISGDEIVSKNLPIIVNEQKDEEKHRLLIDLESVLLDGIYQKYFEGFFVFTDGEANIYADVTDYQKTHRGYLGIDYEDFKGGIENDFDKSRFLHSIISQLSRAVITDKNQIDYSKSVSITLAGVGTIKEGTKKDSYIYQFYNRYWSDILYLDSIATSNSNYENGRRNFYLRHQDDFLNEYTSINPFNDIIESMTRFILMEEITESGLKGEKIRFFYEYDEINELKKRIKENITILEER